MDTSWFASEFTVRRVLATVRGGAARAVEATARTLGNAGAALVEAALTCPAAAVTLVRLACGTVPDRWIRARTVLHTEQVAAALRTGTSFVVTPGLGSGATRSVELGLSTLTGALTPTEVAAALELGASAVKLFPAAALGTTHVKALHDGTFPEAMLVPVGGRGRGDVAGYFADGGDLEAQARRAVDLLPAVVLR